jgi:hypothetical protein
MRHQKLCVICLGDLPIQTKVLESSNEWQITVAGYLAPFRRGSIAWNVRHVPSGVAAHAHRCLDQKLADQIQLSVTGAAPDAPASARLWETVIRKAVTVFPWLRETRGRRSEPDIYIRLFEEVARRLRGETSTSLPHVAAGLGVSEGQIERAYRSQGFKSWPRFVRYVRKGLDHTKS